MRSMQGRALVVACLVGCLATASLAAGGGDKATESVIRAGTESWLKAYNAGDVETIVSLYAEDALVMPPGAPAVKGHAAIRKWATEDTAGARASGVTLVNGSVNEVGVSADLAWHAGNYTVRDKSGSTVDSGSYLEAWQKVGGKWRIVRDIWNSDRPPAPPAPPAAKMR